MKYWLANAGQWYIPEDIHRWDSWKLSSSPRFQAIWKYLKIKLIGLESKLTKERKNARKSQQNYKLKMNFISKRKVILCTKNDERSIRRFEKKWLNLCAAQAQAHCMKNERGGASVLCFESCESMLGDCRWCRLLCVGTFLLS